MKGQFIPYSDENPTESMPLVTWALIAANVLVFLWSLMDFEAVITTWGFIPSLFVPATLVTSMFLHGGFGHIFGNMLFLYIYGDNVEDRFGKLRFLGFYLAAGIFAGIVHFLSGPSSMVPTVGASGAISGVLGAYLAMFPKVKVRTIGPYFIMLRIQASVLIGIWFVMQLLLGAFSVLGFGSGIAFFAHIGGFVFGYIAGRIYNKKRPKKAPRHVMGFFPVSK